MPMDKKKLVQSAEGLAITAAGVLFTVLSAQIRKNPVEVSGTLRFLTEDKFVPLVLSVLIVLQGIRLTVALWKGKEVSGKLGATPRSVSVVLLTLAYLLLVSRFGFAVPTAVYLTALLFVANRGRRPLELLVLAGVYCLIALVLIPLALGLQLL